MLTTNHCAPHKILLRLYACLYEFSSFIFAETSSCDPLLKISHSGIFFSLILLNSAVCASKEGCVYSNLQIRKSPTLLGKIENWPNPLRICNNSIIRYRNQNNTKICPTQQYEYVCTCEDKISTQDMANNCSCKCATGSNQRCHSPSSMS